MDVSSPGTKTPVVTGLNMASFSDDDNSAHRGRSVSQTYTTDKDSSILSSEDDDSFTEVSSEEEGTSRSEDDSDEGGTMVKIW